MKAVLFGTLFLTFNHALALTPVEEAAMLAKLTEQLTQLEKQVDLLQQSTELAKKSQAHLEGLKDAHVGHYGYGNLHNSLNDLTRRQWAPNSWDEALKKVAGNNPSRYQELLTSYERRMQPMKEEDFIRGANRQQFKRYEQGIAVNRAASTQSAYVYNDINDHLKTIHELADQIERTPNTKGAMDLNSRLLAELAYLETEELKMQSLLSQQLAQTAAEELIDARETAEFNRLPDDSDKEMP